MTRPHPPHAIIVKLNRRNCPHTRNSGLSWCLSSSLSLSVGLSTQDEVMDVTRFALQGAHYHADVIYLSPLTWNNEGNMGFILLRVKPARSRFPIHIFYTPLNNTPLHSIPSVCRLRGGFVAIVGSSVPWAYLRVTLAPFQGRW